MQDFLTKSGVTAEELGRTINNQVRSLPGSFETSSQLLGAIARNATFERPNDYYATLADRYRPMNAADLDAAARRYIRPNDPIRSQGRRVGNQLVRPCRRRGPASSRNNTLCRIPKPIHKKR